MMPRAFWIPLFAVFVACGSRTVNDSGAGDGGSDTRRDVPAGCALKCGLSCELAERNGCPICECKRKPAECATDDDCVLATNAGVCCPQCARAVAKKTVDAERCLVPLFGSVSGCKDDCSATACPLLQCIEPGHAVCEAGKCTTRAGCPEGEVRQAIGGCAPKCTVHSDCVRAQRVSCCAGCGTSVHTDLGKRHPCLSTGDKHQAPSCRQLQCSTTSPCPKIACDQAMPTCGRDGRCR